RKSGSQIAGGGIYVRRVERCRYVIRIALECATRHVIRDRRKRVPRADHELFEGAVRDSDVGSEQLVRNADTAIAGNSARPADRDRVGGKVVLRGASVLLGGNGVLLPPNTVVDGQFPVYLPLIAD